MKNTFIGSKIEDGKEVSYNLNSLTQHAAVLGTTGSGKTVMCKVLIEEALAAGIPVIAIDPKGDIGGLGIISKTFDFRPFVSSPEKTQKLYLSNFQNLNNSNLNKLSQIKPKIFTPKSSIGAQISLVPELTAPDGFKEELEKNPSISAGLIDPLSESICQLAGLSLNYEKAKSLISSIILYNWNLGQDLTIESLISQIIKPSFENVGMLSLEDFLKEADRLKIASSINLILSSPSKQAWKAGEKVNVKKMFEPGNLSIFDLRYTGSTEDKQYAVEQILQEIYRFLLHKGGTDKLKYILYIDELAGLLPPPPSSPPCKKSLETLIRQARAFGLGILLATQNPGDIDYKILGNIGTRFIGKLRTENDMDKVATAIGISLSTLKQALLTFKTGDFFYNNSVENKSLKIHSRWLYSYHSGPLKETEIRWVNNPQTRPVVGNLLELPSKESSRETFRNSFPENYALKILNKLKEQTKEYSDKTKFLIEDSPSREYVPYLSITIEPKPFKKKSFSSLGPYIFDLTNKSKLNENSLKSGNWKSIKKYNYKIVSPKRSIKKSIYQAIGNSQINLKRRLYQSKVTDVVDEEKDNVITSNYNYMKEELISAKRILTEKSFRGENKIIKILEANTKKMNSIKNRVRVIKAGRLVRKIFGNKRLSDKTKRIKKMERTIVKLRKKGKLIKQRIKKHKQALREKTSVLEGKLYQKSHTLTKSHTYNPSRKDIIVHANLFLVPKEKTIY
jgi:hypothetical protein